MKKTLHLAATVLCLLTLFISTASCMAAQLPHPQHTSCDDCPKHTPVSQNTPACCSADQQPSATTSSVEVERPAPLPNAIAPLTLNIFAPSVLSAIAAHPKPPHSPLLIALRI